MADPTATKMTELLCDGRRELLRRARVQKLLILPSLYSGPLGQPRVCIVACSQGAKGACAGLHCHEFSPSWGWGWA